MSTRSWLLICAASALSTVASCVSGGGPAAQNDTGVDTAVEGTDAPVIPETDTPTTAGDGDGDGVPVPADCDDTNAAISPLATEDCLTLDVDEDCDAHPAETDPDCDPDIDEDIDEDMDEDTDEDDDDEKEEDDGK